MPRPKKHPEGTVSITVRLPASLVGSLTSRYPGTLTDAVEQVLRDGLGEVPMEVDELGPVVVRTPEKRPTKPLDVVHPPDCTHKRTTNVVGGKKCMDCGKHKKLNGGWV